MAGKIEEKLELIFAGASRSFEGNVVLERTSDGQIIVRYGVVREFESDPGADYVNEIIENTETTILNSALDEAILACYPDKKEVIREVPPCGHNYCSNCGNRL